MARLVDQELDNGGWSEPWRHLKIKAALVRGKDTDALNAIEDALRRFPFSLRCIFWRETCIALTIEKRSP